MTLLVQTIYLPVTCLILHPGNIFWQIWTKAQKHRLLSLFAIKAAPLVAVVNISFLVLKTLGLHVQDMWNMQCKSDCLVMEVLIATIISVWFITLT